MPVTEPLKTFVAENTYPSACDILLEYQLHCHNTLARRNDTLKESATKSYLIIVRNWLLSIVP